MTRIRRWARQANANFLKYAVQAVTLLPELRVLLCRDAVVLRLCAAAKLLRCGTGAEVVTVKLHRLYGCVAASFS